MFEWDKENTSYIAEHGVTAAEAEQIINNNPLDIEYQQRNKEE